MSRTKALAAVERSIRDARAASSPAPMDPHSAISDRAQRQVYGTSLLLAPLLLAASTFCWIGRDVGIAGGTLAVVSAVFWIAGLLGLVEWLRPHRPRTAAVMTVIVIYAVIAYNNFGMEGIYQEALKVVGAGEVSRPALRNAFGPASLLIVMLLPGGMFPLSIVVLSVLLWRVKAIPAWCMIVLCLGGLSFPVGRIPRIPAIAHATDLLLLIGVAPVAWRYLRSRPA